MGYYIYNMGMPVRVPPADLLDKRKTKPLTAIASSARLHSSEEQDNKAAAVHRSITGYQEQEQQRQQVYSAGQIMTPEVKILLTNTSFDDAWRLFRTTRYRHFPVVDLQHNLVGIIADRDVLNYAASGKTHKITIDKLMTTPVLTATANTPIREVCHVMFSQHIGALPIIDKQTGIIGIITRSDILRSMIKHGPMELWV